MRVKCRFFGALLFFCIILVNELVPAVSLGTTIPDILNGTKEVLVEAHRASYGGLPENSIAAIEACIAAGVDSVEIDLRKSSDGVYLLMHDSAINRTTNGSGYVSSYTMEELKQFRLKDAAGSLTDERIPTFDEVIDICKDRIMMGLDLKAVTLDEALAALSAKDAVSSARCSVSSVERAETILAGYPDANINGYINYRNGATWPEPGAGLDNWMPFYDTGIQPKLFFIGFSDFDNPAVDAPTLLALRMAGARCYLLTLSVSNFGGLLDSNAIKDPRGVWGPAIDRGFSIIMTDEPEHLMGYLEERQYDTNTTEQVSYEAEDAELTQVTVSNDYGGYSGSGYIDYNTEAGGTVSWFVDIAADAPYILDFRYALGDADEALEVKVDGLTVDSDLAFHRTTSWTSWQYSHPLELDLTAGSHVIELSSPGANAVNLDALRLRQSSLKPVIKSVNAPQVSSQGSTPLFAWISDAAGDPVTINWTQVAGPGTASFTDSSNARTDVSFDTFGTYVLQVTATDIDGSSTATIEIAVGPTPPVFAEDSFSTSDGYLNWPYSDSIAGAASDTNGNPITYAKVSGPAWLNVASDGMLSGTPTGSDVGLNTFTVSATDIDGSDTATLNIELMSLPSKPDAIMHFNARGMVGVSDGDFVGVWQDISGNGNNARQITDNARPIYVSDAINGKPIIRFDGSNDWLDLPDSKNGVDIPVNDVTVFAVARYTGSGQYIMTGQSSSGSDRLRFKTHGSNFTARVGGSGYIFGPLWDLDFHIFALTSRTDGSYDFYLDGVLVTSGLSSSDLYVGKFGLGSYGEGEKEFSAVDIAEFIVYDRAMVEPEIVSEVLHLKAMWNWPDVVRGDVNYDSEVTLADVIAMSEQWLKTNGCEQNDWCYGADINQSGIVNLNDLSLLSEDWLTNSSR